MSLDLIIKGGSIVDGSGGPAFLGDVGIRDGIIVEVGQVASAASQVIDAEGAIVMPGFVDMHTHYDAQVMWDQDLSLSSRHGVTTAIMGNCGVGCAPCRPETREAIELLMAGVEDIPISAMNAGLDWKWESFPDFLDRIAEVPRTIDVGAYIAHAPVRSFVMGERATAASLPTQDESLRMADIVREALRAGAVGFSTGRIFEHRCADGQHTPDYDASDEELLCLADAVAEVPGRTIQFATDFHQFAGTGAMHRDMSLAEAMARRARCPLSMQLLEWPRLGEQGWRTIRDHFLALNAKGMQFRFEVPTRAIGMMMGLGLSMHPFLLHPSYAHIRDLPPAEQVKRLRDPNLRRQILAEEPKLTREDDPIEAMIASMAALASKIYLYEGAKAYEPSQDQSISALAEKRNVGVMEAYYDYLTQEGEQRFLYYPVRNYEQGNLDVAREMLTGSDALISFGDAGAHSSMICDSAYTSFGLSYWGRDRGDHSGIQLERLVQLMSGAPAAHFGLEDRGLVRPGRRADLNVVDMGRLALEPMHIAKDLPGGGQRLLQFASGYRATLVAGRVIVRDSELTGERPGRLVRAGQGRYAC